MQRVDNIEKQLKRFEDNLRQVGEELDHVRENGEMLQLDEDAVQQLNVQKSENMYLMESLLEENRKRIHKTKHTWFWSI